MGFRKVDCKSELQRVMKEDPKIVKHVEEFNHEYGLIQSLIKARKEAGLTQKDVSKRSGLTQQMISRIEKIDNSPTLTNLLKYIDAIGVAFNVQKIKM